MHIRTPLVLLFVGSVASAQESDAAFEKALETSRGLSAVKFSTIAEQDHAMTRRFRGMMPGAGETEIDGSWSGDTLYASINVGEDEVVFHRGQMIARAGEGDWKRRYQVLADGGPVPFVFEPPRFLAAFVDLPADSRQVQRATPTTYRNKEYMLYSVTLEGAAAREFNWSGAIPRLASPSLQMIGMSQLQAPPDVTIDVAFYVDPTTDLVHRIKVKTYQGSSLPAGMRIQLGGPGGGDDVEAEEPEKVDEFDADGKRIYRRGMPVRNVDSDTSFMDYDVRLSDHGNAKPPELDAEARRLLGMR